MSEELTTIDYSKHAGVGMENVSADDLQIPFLQLVQTNSAEVDKGHPDHATKSIAGVEAGDIINTVSRKVISKYEENLPVIPITYSKAFVEWRPRDQGGGMIQVHADANILTSCTKNESFKDILENGNEIVTTAYYVVMYKDVEWEKAIIAMQATQLKKSRTWLSKIASIKLKDGDGNRFQAPIFSHSYNLSSITESNNRGSWFGWKIELDGKVEDSSLVDEAISLLKSNAIPQLNNNSEDPF